MTIRRFNSVADARGADPVPCEPGTSDMRRIAAHGYQYLLRGENTVTIGLSLAGEALVGEDEPLSDGELIAWARRAVEGGEPGGGQVITSNAQYAREWADAAEAYGIERVGMFDGKWRIVIRPVAA